MTVTGTPIREIPRPQSKAARRFPFVATHGQLVYGAATHRGALRDAVRLSKTFGGVSHVVAVRRGPRDPKPRIIATCIPTGRTPARHVTCTLTEKPRKRR